MTKTLDTTLDQSLDDLYRRREALTEADWASLGPALTTLALEQSAQDGLFWLRFVKTRDEADPTQTVKAFPLHLQYLHILWKTLATQPRLVIAKSRQMLVSWVAAAFCCWTARFTPNQAVYYQAQQFDDAAGMIALAEGGYTGRCQFIEEHLPPWMQLDVKFTEGRAQYPNGSMIQALAGGADKIRGRVVSLYIADEFSRQEDQQGVYAAIAPLMQKGARVAFISTPNGLDNHFSVLFHGRPMLGAR